MRALVKTTAGPGLELIDVPEPRCGPSDVKVRVLRAGLCGTDLHIHDWDDWAASTVKAPLIVGHEFFTCASTRSESALTVTAPSPT